MCGRYTHLITWKMLREIMALLMEDEPDGFSSTRYNIAPTQRAPVIRANEKGERSAAMLRWGLAPHWSKTPERGPINARVEGIADKPMFRTAIKSRRCIVPASGFYEWQVIDGSKTKQPWYMTPSPSSEVPFFAFAGLWESHDEIGETFCILTTAPNELMRPIHDRMPVILHREQWENWLACEPIRSDLAQSFPAESMAARRVGTRLNSPKIDEPSLIEAADAQPRSSRPVEKKHDSLFG